MMRMIDRRGGVDSVSVRRVVGRDADLETRKLQLRFNQHSRTPVFQKFCLGMSLMEKKSVSDGEESLLGRRIWSGIKVPLFLVAGEDDKLAPSTGVEQITTWLTRRQSEAFVNEESEQSAIQKNGKPAARFDDDDVAPDEMSSTPTALQGESQKPPAIAGDVQTAQERLTHIQPVQFKPSNSESIEENDTSTKHSFALKTTIFPSPSSHGLLYATADVRILSGLIENFMAKYVDKRLSPGWQLQHLTTSGKWDVKNLAKWQSIAACSEPIGGVFRAMKTMREVDDEHCPRRFVEKFGFPALPDGVAMVVDISHESPVYDKNGLEQAGVEYHKFPTVSKLPPTADEVEHFISLIDSLRRSPVLQPASEGAVHPMIGVHCHYGFNRTGFFIVCYLVERLGYKLQDAVEEFKAKRAPGIKHEYFVNELYVRYAVKMQRRGTLIG